MFRYSSVLCMTFLIVSTSLFGQQSRVLQSYELDVYGPTPFPELVDKYIDSEISVILNQQRKDGSFAFFKGRKTSAGGTVCELTQAALNAYSLRNFIERRPKEISEALNKAVDHIVDMVRTGKLRTNVRDSPWRLTYVLRFLVNEYPFVKDALKAKQIEDACQFLVDELIDAQQATLGEKALEFHLGMHSHLGIEVEEDSEKGTCFISAIHEDSVAKSSGLQIGDYLLIANDRIIDTVLKFHSNSRYWHGGMNLKLKVQRQGVFKEVKLVLPYIYPGHLGVDLDENLKVLSSSTSIPKGSFILSVNRVEVKSREDVMALELKSGTNCKLRVKVGDNEKDLDVVCLPKNPSDFGVHIHGSLDQGRGAGQWIWKVNNGSSFKAAGIKGEDRIISINGKLVLNRRHFYQLERMFPAGSQLEVVYQRHADKKIVKVNLQSGEKRDAFIPYRGVNMKRKGASVFVSSVNEGSPAERAGLLAGDIVKSINGERISPSNALRVYKSVLAGQEFHFLVDRKGVQKSIQWQAALPAQSPWIANNKKKGGGWAYYFYVKGGTSFLTADIMEVLLEAQKINGLQIPEEVLEKAFGMQTGIRRRQANAKSDSYAYDAHGSFQNWKDIRGDIGRSAAVELMLVKYSDHRGGKLGAVRTQKHLKEALVDWRKHRAILDLVRKDGHGKYSIAPWYLRYSYYSAVKAAEYLQGEEELKSFIRNITLKQTFATTKFRDVKDLGAKGWIRDVHIGVKKELLDSTLILDTFALMKPYLHTSQPISIKDGTLKEAVAFFKGSQYGKSYLELQKVKSKESKMVLKAIEERFNFRMKEIEEIYNKFPADGLRFLKQMKNSFAGYPNMKSVEKLISEWTEVISQNK